MRKTFSLKVIERLFNKELFAIYVQNIFVVSYIFQITLVRFKLKINSFYPKIIFSFNTFSMSRIENFLKNNNVFLSLCCTCVCRVLCMWVTSFMVRLKLCTFRSELLKTIFFAIRKVPTNTLPIGFNLLNIIMSWCSIWIDEILMSLYLQLFIF